MTRPKVVGPIRTLPVQDIEDLKRFVNFELMPYLKKLEQQVILHGNGAPTFTPSTKTAIYLQDDAALDFTFWVFSAGVWRTVVDWQS